MQTKGITVAPKANYALTQGRETDLIAEVKRRGSGCFEVGVLFPIDMTNDPSPAIARMGSLYLSEGGRQANSGYAYIERDVIRLILGQTLREFNMLDVRGEAAAFQLVRPFERRTLTLIVPTDQEDYEWLARVAPEQDDIISSVRSKCGFNPDPSAADTRIVSLRSLLQLASWVSGYGIGFTGVRFGDPNIRRENVVLVRGFHTSVDKILNPSVDRLATGRRRVNLDD